MGSSQEPFGCQRSNARSVARSSRTFGVLLLHFHSHEHHVQLNQRESVYVKMAEIEIPMVRLKNQGLEVLKFRYACIRLTGVYDPPVSDEDGIALMKYYGRDYHGIQTRWEISITKFVLACYSWPRHCG